MSSDSQPFAEAAALSALPFGALILDPSNRVIAWNLWMARVSGISPDKIKGNDISNFFAIPERGKLCLQWAREQNRPYVLSQKIHGYFLPIPFPPDHISGFSHMQQETQVIPLDSPDGHLLVTIRDITPLVISDMRLKFLQKELDAALDQAEMANRSKGEFLSMASHDLRTPMNGVLGFSNLLAETKLDAEQEEYVAAIVSSSKVMLTLLNDILDFSKIEAGKLEIHPMPFLIRESVQKALRFNENLASEKAIKLQATFAENLPEILLADEIRFQQILINLINNALKFTDHGTVKVLVGGEPRGEKQWILEVAVEDTGYGIRAEDLPHLFEPYTQVSKTALRGGSGLGLSISKKLCNLLDGDIEVESVWQEGSKFTFRLPTEIIDRATEGSKTETPPAEKSRGESNRTDSKAGKGIAVLIVDDVAMNRKFAEVLLRKIGCEPDSVCSGEEALQALAKNQYDVIFMDIKMPDMDGLETTQVIRSGKVGEKNRSIPICALTALAMSTNRDQCLDAGMNDFITKPLRIGDIEPALRRIGLLE